MRLDVLLPTHNRQELLSKALQSLASARIPPTLELRVIVLDNNSTDRTKQVVGEHAERFHGRLEYMLAARQGKSCALNDGIAATDGDVVAMIDDDEEVEEGWFETIERVFRTESIDFIGGKVLPRWGGAIPQWLPRGLSGVIGWIDAGDEVQEFATQYTGILMGGNAVITRSALMQAGPYRESLGPSGKRHLCGEDEEMYSRLLAIGARGLYVPDLIVYHHVPAIRLTKRYYRKWCFWRGVSAGLIDRMQKQPVVYVAGVPRYLIGRTARAALRRSAGRLVPRRAAAERFADELTVFDFAGFVYGKHFFRTAK